jgi:hypothetical protein
MSDRPELLAPVAPERWIDRFIEGAAGGVAFVTPAGHVLSWSQFRLAYPRYRAVDPEWQPPTHSLEAFVLHFGAYEVTIPAGAFEMAGGLLSEYATQRRRLTEAVAHPDDLDPLSMEAQIYIERRAAVHARIEVILAAYAFERTSLQDLLTVPGVRLERSIARLSEVAFRLRDERVTEDELADATEHVFDDAQIRRMKETRNARSQPADAIVALDHERKIAAERALTELSKLLYRDPRIQRLYDTVQSNGADAGRDPRTFRDLMVVEAVRERFTTRELLRLIAALRHNRADASGKDLRDDDYWFWTVPLMQLKQYRTAWCLAIRALDGMWRDRRHHAPPTGSIRPTYALERGSRLWTVRELALHADHPYWSDVFEKWYEDFDEGNRSFRKQVVESSRMQEVEKVYDEALLARVRSQNTIRDVE